MKTKMTLFFLIAFTCFGIQNANAQEVKSGAKISANKEIHDYGSIKAGSNGVCEFVIKNEGTEPLVLATVKGSCQCTVPSWPTEPIAPGESAIISVKYNTENVGPINKTVTITSNAVNEPIKVLRISGNVLPKDEGTSPVTNSGPVVGH